LAWNDEASELGRRNAARYPNADTVLAWYWWCAANEHEDLKDAFKLWKEWLNKYHSDRPTFKRELEYADLEYFRYLRDYKKISELLEIRLKRKETYLPGEAFFLIAVNDIIGDTDKRDAAVQDLLARGKTKPTIYSAVAVAMKDYFKTGTLDYALMRKQLSSISFTPEEKQALDYFVTMIRVKREGKQIDKETIEYLAAHARLTTNHHASPLYWCLLRDVGVPPEKLDNRLFSGGWATE